MLFQAGFAAQQAIQKLKIMPNLLKSAYNMARTIAEVNK
jgi:hypothetical protein